MSHTVLAQLQANVSISTTPPGGITFESPAKLITAGNGFSTIASPNDQIPLGTYNEGRVTRMITPAYTLGTTVSTIYFAMTLSTPAGTTSTPSSFSLDVKYGGCLCGTYSGGGIGTFPTITDVPTVYYFSVTLTDLSMNPVPITAGTPFRIELTLDITISGAGGEDIIVTDFAMQSDAILLPVNFKSITAKKLGKDVQVAWEVGDENNVDHYDIERSTNGRDFVKVGQVVATNSPAYNYVDNHPASGISFYRIKNVDIDGKSKYSMIVRLNLNAIIALQAYPQPALGSITVEHGNAVNGNLHLFTVGGQMVKTIKVSPDRNQTPVDISSLNKGLYMLRFDNGQGSIETIKIVKQ